jgi:hypothetical protein
MFNYHSLFATLTANRKKWVLEEGGWKMVWDNGAYC